MFGYSIIKTKSLLQLTGAMKATLDDCAELRSLLLSATAHLKSYNIGRAAAMKVLESLCTSGDISRRMHNASLMTLHFLSGTTPPMALLPLAEQFGVTFDPPTNSEVLAARAAATGGN